MKLRQASVLIALAFLFVAAPATAESDDDDKQDVIVVFQKDTPFYQFRGYEQSDDRSAAEPRNWGYLDRNVKGAVQRLEGQHRFKSRHVYSNVVKGFAGRLTKAQIEALKAEPTVAYVELDGEVHSDAQSLPWGIDRVEADRSSTLAGNGSGSIDNVTVYVIDSGIATRPDLNLVGHINFTTGTNTDCAGHGTHVAGTIAARDNDLEVVGVAPGARLYGVKVLNCEGSGQRSNVIKAVDWVTANAVKPAVANMSLGGDVGQSLDDAVRRSADSGVFYAVSAGNDGGSACKQSPARAGRNLDGLPNGVIATGSTTSTNAKASSSNYGVCVDLWAPGDKIVSTNRTGGVTTKSGTSMASPHVAGAAALYLSTHPTATAREVEGALLNNALLTGKKTPDKRDINLLQVDRF
jgi:subtilisin family serine protease